MESAITMQSQKNRNIDKGKIISIHSGKSGVGKSQLAVNLAIALQQSEKSVLLIDTNVLSSSVHRYLGMDPVCSLHDVFVSGKPLVDVIQKYNGNLAVIYGILTNKDDIVDPKIELDYLIKQIQELTKTYQYIIIDQAAGLSEFIQLMSSEADSTLIVTTPEPEAVSDTYALVKVLSGLKPTHHFKVVVNQAKSEEEAQEVFERFYLVVEHFLQTEVDFWGYMTADKHVLQAFESQQPFILSSPGCKAAKCIDEIKDRIIG